MGQAKRKRKAGRNVEIMREAGYVPISRVATVLGFSVSTVHRWCNEGKVESVRSDSRGFVKVSSLRSMFADNPPMLAQVGKL